MRITSEITLKGVEEKDSHEDLIDRVVEKCFEIENLDENKVYVAITLTTPEEIREMAANVNLLYANGMEIEKTETNEEKERYRYA